MAKKVNRTHGRDGYCRACHTRKAQGLYCPVCLGRMEDRARRLVKGGAIKW